MMLAAEKRNVNPFLDDSNATDGASIMEYVVARPDPAVALTRRRETNPPLWAEG
jgi:hypothetical protein